MADLARKTHLTAYIPDILAETAKQPPVSIYNKIINRNIFHPLWNVSDSKDTNISKKADIEAAKKLEEQRELERKQADQRRLEDKKKDVETNYILTGIIYETDGPKAAIQSKRNPNSSFIVKPGDNVDDLKVMSVNSSNSEVLLDYDGKFQVTLRMQ
jgi:hypothetical protein